MLVVQDRYCDRDRSTRLRFAVHSVPSLSLRALKATLVLWTVTFDFASQSLTCLSTANLCVPLKVLTFMCIREKEGPGMIMRGQVLHAINPEGD